MTTTGSAVRAATPYLLPQPGWVLVGDYPPAFTAVVADALATHHDPDVQEIGRRIRAANPLDVEGLCGHGINADCECCGNDQPTEGGDR